MAMNPDYNKEFRCDAYDYHGFIIAYTSLEGQPLHKLVLNPSLRVTTSLSARIIPANLVTGENSTLLVTTSLKANFVSEYSKSNWVGWSKIGDITFIQDLTNESGYKPMTWKGIVYSILKLGKDAIVYGSGGITRMYPVSDPSPTFGFEDIFPFGIKNKTAVCGGLNRHFFISRSNELWEVIERKATFQASGQYKNHGYAEYLSTLIDPTMFFDEMNERVYISDATHGFVLTDKGLGGGYAGISGLAFYQGIMQVTSPQLITLSPLLVVTDILDFGYRGMEMIEWVQVATDTPTDIYVAIDYRYDKAADFQTTPWVRTNKEGVAHVRTAGVEFRVRIKNDAFQALAIDYLHISFKVTDNRFIRGRQEVLKYGA